MMTGPLILGIYALTAPVVTPSFPSVSSLASVVVSAGTNWLDAATFTNTWWWGCTNNSSSAIVGPQYTVTVNTNFSIISASGPSDKCSVLQAGNSLYTTWLGSGKAAVNMALLRSNVLSYYSVGIDCTTNASASVAIPIFSNFVATTLLNAAWTNFIARTNGKQAQLWTTYTLPAGWPSNGVPTLAWNTNNLIYGLTSATAISQCQTAQGARGQVPMTALTRRHLYSRGHGSGSSGWKTNSAATTIYFCTTSNTLVSVSSTNSLTHYSLGDNQDFSIIVLSSDLPDSITPLRVVNFADWAARFPSGSYTPWPLLTSHQTGILDAGNQVGGGFVQPTIAGDSGSPTLLWLGNELFFVCGVSTSGPSAIMDTAMTTASDAMGISTNTYHLNYFGITSYSTIP